MKNKLKINNRKSLGDQVKDNTKNQSQTDQVNSENGTEKDIDNFTKWGKKYSSMVYSMPIYRILNELKIEGKEKNLNKFVNLAVKEKLIECYPAEVEKILEAL